MTAVFTELLQKIQASPNHISPSAYDTAWLAWLSPQAREWLVNAQHPDGSWGAELEYYHDRVISTLAAINAIAATCTNQHDLARIEPGIRYLERAIPHLSEDVYETVAFELLLPSLVQTGQALGLKYDEVARLIEPQLPIYYQKLALLPEKMLYSPATTIPHSLEFVGFQKLDHNAILPLRAGNGSIHNSPSATAFVEVAIQGSDQGRAYLERILAERGNTAPLLFPFETFEIVWSLYHIGLQESLTTLAPDFLPLIDTIKAAWGKKRGWLF